MMSKKILIPVISIVLLLGCGQIKPEIITHSEDYRRFMHAENQQSLKSLRFILDDINFWQQRLINGVAENPVARVKLAQLYSEKFKVAGQIEDLHTSDSLYLLANPLIKTGSSSVYRSLAANCITQHRFRQALFYIDTALSMGDDKYHSLLMECDVAMELGNIVQAKKALEQLDGKNSFDYRIRKAKILDHEGDLDAAITFMEKGLQEVIESGNDYLFGWFKSNLGDMYGHANRYKDAYRSYLEALEKNPENFYALKGIAWLAFSHDKNVKDARKILDYLYSVHPVPDYKLMMAEIASYENNLEENEKLLNEFKKEVKKPAYADMYLKYLFNIAADDPENIREALQIAEKEIQNRPTPQSYAMLAWAKFRSGDKEEALTIAQKHVENKNFEPDALHQLGVIYAGMGKFSKALNFLRQAGQSSFELGPVTEKRIKSEISRLYKTSANQGILF